MDGAALAAWVKVLAALAVVLAIFAVVVAVLRRLHPTMTAAGARQGFRVRRRLVLGPKTSVVELEHEGRRYLVLVGEGIARALPPSAALPPSSHEPCHEDGLKDGMP